MNFLIQDISDHVRVKLAFPRNFGFYILSGFTFVFHCLYLLNH